MDSCINGGIVRDGPLAGFKRGSFQCTAGRTAPVCARVSAEDGRYLLTITLAAQRDAQEALLFVNHRRLIWRGRLMAGERVEVKAACMIHPYLPDDADEPVKSGGIEVALVGEGVMIESVYAKKSDIRAVLLMGDSTVTDQSAESPYAPGATYCGWGQMLPAFLGECACVGNFARSGMTAETFRTEGLYDVMKAQLRAGDLVLMQFGHNDQKRLHLTAKGGFTQALERYIRELRALGAKVLLVTPLARNSWWNAQEYCDLLLPFAGAAKALGEKTGTEVIDQHAFMRDHLILTGRDTAKALFHIGDYTHTNDFGAFLAAGFVAGELKRLALPEIRADEEWTPHGPYDVPASDQGDESLPPTGLEALFRNFETLRPDAPLTRQEGIELICRTCGLFAFNEDVALPADVPLAEAFSGDIRCALQHRLIPPQMISDGKLHRRRAMTAHEFMTMLRRAYGMRCNPETLMKVEGEYVTRAQAAAVCRGAKI